MKKKISILVYPLIAMGLLLILTNGCKKDDNKNPIETGPVTDIDGNVYHTVTIGTQIWMVENLKVTKYRNGDAIPNVTNGTEWSNLETGAYCDYDNTPGNSTVYGKLYNWYAVADSRKIAPTGWHVPSDAEWTTLIVFLGGKDIAGGKLKEKGTVHWLSPNEGATNETGFTALPGGYRGTFGSYYSMGEYAGILSSPEHSGSGIWPLCLFYDASYSALWVFRWDNGGSVRCLKD